MEFKNRGVLLGQRETDYVAGAGSPIPYVINKEDGDWRDSEPTPENQYGLGGDRYNCVTQSGQNTIKMFLNQQVRENKIPPDFKAWLTKKNFFDEFGKLQFSVRFNTITNGTIPGKGNWLYIVADDFKNTGLIPESMLPDDNDISEAEYFNPKVITQEMLDMGKEFLTWVKINYEWIDPTVAELQKHLKQFPIQIIVNSGTHAVAEITQLSDIYYKWDSYPPYEVQASNAVMPWTPLKYVMTYLNNQTNQPNQKIMRYVIVGKEQYLLDDNLKLALNIGDETELAELVKWGLKGSPESIANIDGYAIYPLIRKSRLRDLFGL